MDNTHKNLLFHFPAASINLKGLIVFANETFLKFFNVTEIEIYNRKIWQIAKETCGEAEAIKVFTYAINSLKSNGLWNGQIRLSLSKDKYISVSVSLLKNRNKKKHEYILVLNPNGLKNSYTIEDSIIAGLKNNLFTVFFQPIICNKTKEIIKYEALLRMSVNGEILSPLYFLSEMKKLDSYSLLTTFIISEITKYINEFYVAISINLSLQDIEDNKSFILELLKKNPILSHFLTIEILEEGFKDAVISTSTFEFIHLLKNNGVLLAIDDFGTKHSNWDRFLDLEPDIIKIDGTLIRGIRRNKYMMNVVETIVEFAKRHNLDIIAEYVEDEELFNIVRDMGIGYSQGYYFGTPQPCATAFSEFYIKNGVHK